MLGFVSVLQRGEGDRLLAGVARHLQADGTAIAGVVQINTEIAPDRPCLMELSVLHSTDTIRISQSLGTLSSGCRLDPSGLESAVAQVELALKTARPRLLILNKFGKHEVEGRGFRPVIGLAMEMGVPVLTAVSAKNLDGFMAFAGDMAELINPNNSAILQWFYNQMVLSAGIPEI